MTELAAALKPHTNGTRHPNFQTVSATQPHEDHKADLCFFAGVECLDGQVGTNYCYKKGKGLKILTQIIAQQTL